MSGQEDGAAPMPSAKSASIRTESSQAKGVGQPLAGCSDHHVAQLKNSQVLRSSDQEPMSILRMLRLCIPTQGQEQHLCTTPQPPSSKASATEIRADVLLKTCMLKIPIHTA